MAVIQTTRAEALMNVDRVREAILKRCPDFVRTQLHVSGSHDTDSYGSIPETPGTLFFVHPRTASFHLSRVKKSAGTYVDKAIEDCKKGEFTNLWIRDTWNYSDFYVFVFVPNSALDYVEMAINSNFTKQYTAKYSVMNGRFYEATVKHACGLTITIPAQESQTDTVDSLVSRANRALKDLLVKMNITPPKNKPGTHKANYFFKDTNCVIDLGTPTTRKHLMSNHLVRGGWNSQSIRAHMPVVECWVNQNNVKPSVIAIGCVSSDNVVGMDGELAIQSKEDMAHFRETTNDAVVIMGRATWESLPDSFKPLPDRTNIVITSTPLYLPGVVTHNDLASAIEMVKSTGKDIFIIGGTGLWEEAFRRGFVKKAIITKSVRNISNMVALQRAHYGKGFKEPTITRFDFDRYLQKAYLSSTRELSPNALDSMLVHEYYL